MIWIVSSDWEIWIDYAVQLTHGVVLTLLLVFTGSVLKTNDHLRQLSDYLFVVLFEKILITVLLVVVTSEPYVSVQMTLFQLYNNSTL